MRTDKLHSSCEGLRFGVVESAKRICERVQHRNDEPCSTCVYNVALLHAEFLSRLPAGVQGMPFGDLSAAIRFAALDA